jgi:hypothetical protein
MRRALVATLGILALLMAALPAQAKVAGTASISGPSIGGPGSGTGDDWTITMRGADYPFLARLYGGSEGSKQPPTEDLGPRYTARFVISGRSFQSVPPVVQHLYPYAQGGPLIHTAPGQEGIGGTGPSGWFPMNQKLMDELIARGLPKQPPVPVQAPAVQAQRQSPTSGPSPVVWVTLLLAGLLVLGAAAGRRAIARRAA